jgi:uncharacterized protein
MIRRKNPERVWHYWIDVDGHLWHEGTELEDPDLLKFFMEKMKKLPDGRFYVLCQGEDCYITAEDVPYVVQNLSLSPNGAAELIFPGGYREPLDPTTLEVGKKNVLYCRIREGAFPARFNRKSYFELAKRVKFDPHKKEYLLTAGGKDYPIRGEIRDEL